MGHYNGVSAHHNVPRVQSYDDAVRAQRAGDLRSKVANIWERMDGAIAFRLYETDVVAWYPDNTVEVDNYGTQTTSGFARRFLPDGIHLHHPSQRRGMEGGHKINSFRSHAVGEGLSWEDAYHVCQGDLVVFAEQGDLWVPKPETCNDITMPMGVDRKASREMAKVYHFAEFESWLTVAPITLGDVEHAEWDLDECLSALKRRDWRQAAMHLPLIKEPNGFGTAARMNPIPIATGIWQHHITMASVSKLKLAMWEDRGLLETETRKTWSRGEYDRRMARVREMDALGLDVRALGPE